MYKFLDPSRSRTASLCHLILINKKENSTLYQFYFFKKNVMQIECERERGRKEANKNGQDDV